MRKLFRIVWIITLVLLALLRSAFIVESVLSTDKALVKKLSKYWTVNVQRVETNGHILRYADLWNQNWQMIIFVHWSPGSMTTWMSMVKQKWLLDEYRVILVDRPWYAWSFLWKAVPSLQDQSDILEQLVDMNRHSQKPILVWHSLWWPIVIKMALDYPEKLSWIVHVAWATDPDSQRIWWVSHFLHLPVIKYGIPPGLRVTNAEKLIHKSELRKLAVDLPWLSVPIVVMHGDADRIVPVESAYYIRDLVKDVTIHRMVEEERNHFIPFEMSWTVLKAITLLAK